MRVPTYQEATNPRFEMSGRFEIADGMLQERLTDLCDQSIIYYQGCILSALLAQKEKEGKQEEAEIIKRISPVAWQV
jgi:hypothetical protein